MNIRFALKYTIAAISCSTVASVAQAQSDFGEARLLRAEMSTASADQRFGLLRPEMAVGAPRWQISREVGIAYTAFDAGGHGWNVPFTFSATNEKKYKLSMQSDGFADTSDASGFSDVLLQFGRTVWTATNPAKKSQRFLSMSTGATVPVGGEIGTKYTKERATISYGSNSQYTSFVITGSLRRSEAVAKADGNPYAQVFSATLGREVGKKTLFGQVLSSHANGSDWSTTIVVGCSFPVGHSTATLSVGQGLDRGARDLGVGLDFSW
jgi:hypothetical protein